jgi:hypothetical protein
MTTRDGHTDYSGDHRGDRRDRKTFDPAAVTVDHDGAGGAWVMIDPVRLGHTYVQDSTWIAFQITFPYPEADVYPHFVRPDLSRADGAVLGAGFHPVQWNPRAIRECSCRAAAIGLTPEWIPRRPKPSR